jgi:hypothetical protein
MTAFIVFAFNKDILLYAGVSLIAIGVTRIIILLRIRQLNKIVEGRVKVINQERSTLSTFVGASQPRTYQKAPRLTLKI